MRTFIVLVVYSAICIAGSVQGQVLFYDDFEAGADPAWGNEYGDWVAVDGVYTSTLQTNDPPTYTSVTTLPDLTDFAVDVDINGVRDGGIYLRSERCDNGLVDGVILVVGGNLGTYNGCYWHVGDCNGYSPQLNAVDIPGLQGSDAHIRIVVSGDFYRAYLNGGTVPITTLTTDAYSSGKVALYEFFDQSFDNVEISLIPTGVSDADLPRPGSILAVFPNPFNPQATITFTLPQTQRATLAVYDLTGTRLDILAERVFTAGEHSVTWNGRDVLGRSVPSGTYCVRVETDAGVAAQKVTLLR